MKDRFYSTCSVPGHHLVDHAYMQMFKCSFGRGFWCVCRFVILGKVCQGIFGPPVARPSHKGRQSVSHVYPRMGTGPSKFGLTTFHVLVVHPLN